MHQGLISLQVNMKRVEKAYRSDPWRIGYYDRCLEELEALQRQVKSEIAAVRERAVAEAEWSRDLEKTEREEGLR